MLAVSPWSRGGWVCSEVFDHTSIIRFIERRFGVSEPNISPWRRAICGDLTSAFDFRQRDAKVPSLPSTAGYVPPDSDRHASYVPVPPLVGKLPEQEPGVRPARPLPYDLRADGAFSGTTLTITFASRGAVGAVFHVTSATGPRSYTVGAGASLTGSWTVLPGADVRVHGPNGFYRQFAGAGPDVTAVPSGSDVQLEISNHSAAAVALTLTDAYADRPSDLKVHGGEAASFLVRTVAGWYDVAVTAPAHPGFVRRLAGHIETGRPSISDPALGSLG
jgi:phospholipase C